MRYTNRRFLSVATAVLALGTPGVASAIAYSDVSLDIRLEAAADAGVSIYYPSVLAGQFEGLGGGFGDFGYDYRPNDDHPNVGLLSNYIGIYAMALAGPLDPPPVVESFAYASMRYGAADPVTGERPPWTVAVLRNTTDTDQVINLTYSTDVFGTVITTLPGEWAQFSFGAQYTYTRSGTAEDYTLFELYDVVSNAFEGSPAPLGGCQISSQTYWCVTSDSIGLVLAPGESLSVYNNSQYVMASAYSPVPLPAAAWLLLSGLGALGVTARRRRTLPSPGLA